MQASASARCALALMVLMLASSLLGLAPAAQVAQPSDAVLTPEVQPAGARALTVWSGTVMVNGDYTVASGDELRILAGADIQMGPGVRIYVDGKLTAQGTVANPVTVSVQQAFIWHDGFQFNATSRGRGSHLQNMTISDAQYGITIYDSNPVIDDLYLDNPDYVGIDLFDSASPIIRRLTVQGGGQDVHGAETHWRYGIGLSVGAGSAPFVQGANFDNLITRAVSYWRGSGGVLRDLNISNISGATLNISAGIYVDDSLPLFEDVSITRSDHGVYIMHTMDNMTTRPVFRRITIEDSQFRGVKIDKADHWNFTTYMMARFHDLEVSGTGGPGARTPGLATAAIELNTSGGWFENVNIHDNPVNGVKLYMTDPSTTFVNTTITSSGASMGGTHNMAGFYSRSSNNGGPTLQNLSVSDSPGTGIFITKGSITGSDWYSHDNGAEGVYIREMFPNVDGITVEDNGHSGIRVYDSKQVWLSNVTSSNNGLSATSPDQGAGLVFIKSNDVMSAGNIVRCRGCSSTGDAWGGVYIEDSIDLRLEDLEVHDPGNGQPAIQADNDGMIWDGYLEILGADIWMNSSSTPAIDLNVVDARIDDLVLMTSNHTGLNWLGSAVPSALSNSTLRGQDCLTLASMPLLESWNLDLHADCVGTVSIIESEVNLTGSTSASGAVSIGPNTHLRLISTHPLQPSTIPSSSTVDHMQYVHLWAVNQNGHGLPNAFVNLSFSQYESDLNMTLPQSGAAVLGPFIGQRFESTGASAITDLWAGCEYDNTSNTTGPHSLNGDLLVLCSILLANQPPFIVWDEPLNGTVVSSGAQLLFNASASWDLDDDPLSYNWTSSIDGDISTGCTMSGNGSLFYANSGPSSVCPVSDGVHQFTLEVCDDQGHCVYETRIIELANMPPDLDVHVHPHPQMDGVVRANFTEIVFINASNSSDPEGDVIHCWTWASYRAQPQSNWSTVPCPMYWNETFSDSPERSFTYHMGFWDGVNPEVYYNFSVELVNEFPHPSFSVSRSANNSDSLVWLDGTSSFDPEGDTIGAWWHSSIDGDLTDDDGDLLVWTGHLSAGTHTLSLRLTDDDSYHINQWSAPFQMTLVVDNSPPVAHIELPADGLVTNSSELIVFSAYGSGDWDALCSESFPGMSSGWLCNPDASGIPDTVTALWTSNQLTAPIGTDWEIQAWLPAGEHVITLTVEDGNNPPVTALISVSVGPSAPVLVLDSPIPDIEVVSDELILFDAQRSWDPDDDNFVLTIESDLLEEPILDEVSPHFWYTRYVPAGLHSLTITLTDSTGRSSVHTQFMRVLASPPVAVIASPLDGQLFGPGASISLNGSDSYDADDDIILYRWYVGSGSTAEVLNETPDALQFLRPGEYLISLQVKDSRGTSGWAFANITVESSWPVMTDLLLEPGRMHAGLKETITARAWVDDPDGTTWECVGWASQGSDVKEQFYLVDDGTGADAYAGDGIWSGRVVFTPGREGWVNIEALCRDGPLEEPRLSNRLSNTIQVEGAAQQSSMLDAFMESLAPAMLTLLVVFSFIGVLLVIARRRRLSADLAMIESWGATSFSELDDELLEDDEDDEQMVDPDADLAEIKESDEEESSDAPELD